MPLCFSKHESIVSTKYKRRISSAVETASLRFNLSHAGVSRNTEADKQETHSWILLKKDR